MALKCKCVFNNLVDQGEFGVCDSTPELYPILPTDCPCPDYVKRKAKITRFEQMAKLKPKKHQPLD